MKEYLDVHGRKGTQSSELLRTKYLKESMAKRKLSSDTLLKTP